MTWLYGPIIAQLISCSGRPHHHVISNVNLVDTLIFGAMRKPISGKELYALITLALEIVHALLSGSDL